MEVTLPESHPNEIAPVVRITFDPDAPKALTLEEVIEIYRNMPAGSLSGSYQKMAESDLAKIPQKKQKTAKE